MTHSHHGNHDHTQINRHFLIAIGANGVFVIIQLIYAYLANSTSLLADAVHNFGDVLSLVLSWLAQHWIRRLPTQVSSYGLKKTSILAALTNGLILVFTSGMIVTEAIYKLINPSAISPGPVIMVALLGILINTTTALLFRDHKEKDLNLRGAFLHLIYDALISAGVVVSAIIFYWTQWLWLDPIVGIIIAMVILKGTWFLFTESFRLLIDKVPREISFVEIYEYLMSQEGVEEVHDLHIWALSTQENALSVHLLMPESTLDDRERLKITDCLREKYKIHHTTIQVEQEAGYCVAKLSPCL